MLSAISNQKLHIFAKNLSFNVIQDRFFSPQHNKVIAYGLRAKTIHLLEIYHELQFSDEIVQLAALLQ